MLRKRIDNINHNFKLNFSLNNNHNINHYEPNIQINKHSLYYAYQIALYSK